MKCCDYSGGDLRTACSFQRVTETPDGSGGYTRAWAAISGAPDRCSYKSASGSERYSSARVEANYRGRIVIRYFAGITAADRVLIDGLAYQILWVDDIDRRKQWLALDLAGGVAT